MARKQTITPRRRKLFLAELKKTGRITAAAKKGEIGRSSWYDLAARDPDFKLEWEDADAEYLDLGEAEAWRRGVEGIDKSTPYIHVLKNETRETRFHKVKEKSDRLLEFCLKNRHPSFKPSKDINVTSSDGSAALATSAQPNVDNLSDDELKTLVQLQRKLHAAPDPVKS